MSRWMFACWLKLQLAGASTVAWDFLPFVYSNNPKYMQLHQSMTASDGAFVCS
jgi:hypothetical protein